MSTFALQPTPTPSMYAHAIADARKQCKFRSFWNKLQCHLAHQAYLSTFHYSQKRKAGFLVERTVGGRRTL
jgi:hypothetical protein